MQKYNSPQPTKHIINNIKPKDVITRINNKEQIIWVRGRTKPFLNDFTKIKQLGNPGAYGVTYRCQRRSDKKSMAVKFVKKNRYFQISPRNRHRFLQGMRDEIDVLKTLNHDNIIQFEGFYEDEQMVYIVMEECKGGELFDRICKRERYSEKDAVNVIKQLLSAIRYMHEDVGVVHCDLKPNNILFLDEREDSPLKIIDFGMSKVLPRLQHLTNLCGTAYYTAPEIIEKQKYNHSSDLWSVGVILFVMIYGYPPFYVDTKKYGKRGERQAIYAKIVQGFEPKIKSIKQYGYGPWFPDDIKTSEEVRHLISKLLETKVRKRYTAKEALTHPWIVKMDKKHDIDSIIMSRLSMFNKNCPFKLVISTVFRNQFFMTRPEHIDQLKQFFNKFDTKKDGVLSFEEFEAAMDSVNGKHIAYPIYHQLTGSSVDIEFTDLLNAMVYDYLISCDERLYDAFWKLDNNNDGIISIQELKMRLKESDPLRWNASIKLIDEELMDKNGSISFKDFLKRMHPKYEAIPSISSLKL